MSATGVSRKPGKGVGARVKALRAAQNGRPWRPYDAFMSQDRYSRAIAQRWMTDGWKCGSQPVVSLVPPVDWNAFAGHRSCAFHLHSWDALGPILRHYDRARDAAYLEFATAMAMDWVSNHPELEEDTFAWYDMAVGLRVYRLAYILDVLARDSSTPAADLGRLLDSLELHLERLADERQFRDHNNHGFFQAAGQLAVAARFSDLPGMSAAHDQAVERLGKLLAAQFSDEGVHLEHSPAYHSAVLATVERIATGDLDISADVTAFRNLMEDALAWMVTPDGTLAMLGDTDEPLLPPAAPEEVATDHLRFILSQGSVGSLPAEHVKAFPKSGYVIFRRVPGRTPNFAQASYLIQACGFHSRAHKHADDLSFVWHDRGEQLLVDSGRYGYRGRTEPGSELHEQGFWYDDPRRVYVESTRAHNTVEIDGRSHERKAVRPYGSALNSWGETRGLLHSEATVRLRRSILHSRVLILNPGQWLVVLDAVADTSGVPHDYVQRFHFGHALEAEPVGTGLSLTVPGQAAPLYALPLLPAEHIGPVRGQEEPLLGWISRREGQFEPTWTDAFAARGVASHVFAALFAFADAKPRVDPESRTNTSGRRARLMWTDDLRRHQIDINRETEHFELRYRRIQEG